MTQVVKTPRNDRKYTAFTEDTCSIGRSTRLNFSSVNNPDQKRDDGKVVRRSRIQRAYSEINAERPSPLDEHLNENGQDNEAYLEALQKDNIQMKKKLNEELKRSNDLIKMLQQMEDKEYQYENFCNVNNKDLQAENRALKARLIKQNDQYNRLYYELELIKNEGNKIRHHTVHILNKNS